MTNEKSVPVVYRATDTGEKACRSAVFSLLHINAQRALSFVVQNEGAVPFDSLLDQVFDGMHSRAISTMHQLEEAGYIEAEAG